MQHVAELQLVCSICMSPCWYGGQKGSMSSSTCVHFTAGGAPWGLNSFVSASALELLSLGYECKQLRNDPTKHMAVECHVACMMHVAVMAGTDGSVAALPGSSCCVNSLKCIWLRYRSSAVCCYALV
jgi:hypothetical protein